MNVSFFQTAVASFALPYGRAQEVGFSWTLSVLLVEQGLDNRLRFEAQFLLLL